MRNKAIKVSDLPDLFGVNSNAPFLLCSKCGAQYSAHSGDYFNHPKDHVFKCCRRNMRLVRSRVVIEDVK